MAAWVVALVGLAVLAAASVASAHIGHTIARAERYLKLDATEADTRFVVSLTLGAAEGASVLADADTDADGEVSEAESAAYLASWGEGLADELPIEIDGQPVDVTWSDGWLDPLGPVSPVPVTVEMVAHLPVTGREHRIVVHDRMVRREVFDRTDVSFRGHDGAELVVAGATEAPPDVEEDQSFVRGGPELSLLTAEVRYPTRSAVTSLHLGVGAAVAAAMILGAWALSRRNKSRRETSTA